MSDVSDTLNQVPDVPTSPAGKFWPIKNPGSLKVATPEIAPVSGRFIGASRGGARTHAGIDLYAKHRDIVVAVADGEVKSFRWFTQGTFALVIDHGDFVMNYGEVARDSLTQYRLATPLFRDGDRVKPFIGISHGSRRAREFPFIGPLGSTVTAGQPIARVGLLSRSSMLHTEFYTPGSFRTAQWKGFDSTPPGNLLNGTTLLQQLASPLEDARPVEKEPGPKDVICA